MDEPCVNTDRELWRERPGDYYADSIHVTQSGAIGINCGGYVIVMPVREWHRLARIPQAPAPTCATCGGSGRVSPAMTGNLSMSIGPCPDCTPPPGPRDCGEGEEP